MPTVPTPIEIPLNKRNLALLLLGATGFVVVGGVMLFQPGGWEQLPLRIVGLVAVLFFGTIGVSMAYRLFQSRIGIRIDERGITDHSSGVSVGLIEWKDITGVATTRLGGERFLLLRTDQPEKYIDRVRNPLVRRAIKANWRMTGTPINISTRALPVSFQELVATIEEAWKRYQEGAYS